MSNPETNIHVLDSAYKPFPSFSDWAARSSVDSVEPGFARVYRDYVVTVPINAASDDDFQLLRVIEKRIMIDDEAPMGTEFAFSARVDELIPSPAGVLQIRASIFADRIIGEMLTELKPLAEKALRGNS